MSNRFNDLNREAPNMTAMGPKAYKNRIHSESKKADGNLPYTFSKPAKGKANNIAVECNKCGRVFGVTEDTILAVCVCKNMVRVKDFVKKELLDE